MNPWKHFFVMFIAVLCSVFITDATADPHFGQVGLLLPFDGSHGPTSATDVSSSGHSPVFNGNAKISAGRSKFGGTSCYFDGKGDYLTVADSEDWNFGTGDFTIEFWVLRTGVSKFEGILGENAVSWNSGVPVIVIYDTRILITEGKLGNKTQASTLFIANTWYHVAFSRGGGFMRLFVNGKLEGFAADTYSYDFNELRIGRYNVGSDYDFGGYLDDLRITKGVARYSSNFEVPAAMKGDAMPTITLLTESTTVAEGASVDLSVTAVGALPISYQWSKGGVEISGATQSTLTLTDVALSAAGDYRVAVSNTMGQADSEAITVTVLRPTSIAEQPEGGSANLGGTFTLKVVVSGTEPISYQWHHGGVPIDGATGSTLRLANLKTADMGSYHVVVSNTVGEQTSDSVSLLMLPTITKLTESMTPVKGEDVELSVTAVGAEPMTYQWYHAGTLIESATSATLYLTDFQSGDSGDYHVAVSNAVGTATSDVVTLSVPPTITRLTDNVSVIEGDTLKLSVTAVGTPPITYQWSKDGTVLEGETTPLFTLTEAEPSDAGIYAVEVNNAAGRAGSIEIMVTVLQPARIVTQPVGGTVVLGDAFSFEVVASGTGPITYEWYHGGALVEESTGSTLQLTDLESADSGEYHVVVSNERETDAGETVAFGKETSDKATLTVMIPPSGVQLSSVMEGGLAQLSATAVVGTEPTTYSWSESGVLTEGDSVVLTATATGSEPLSYQWYYAGKLIEDVTANSLRLANVQDTISGEYQVVVTNEVGSDTSEPMTLAVKPAGTIIELAGTITVIDGENVELTVTATGTEPLTYRWSKDGAAIDEATTPGYTLDNTGQTVAGEYKLAVNQDGTLVGSAAITVVLAEPPIIVTQPVGGNADLGGAFTFEVVATGTEPLSYEWTLGGAAVEGGTGSTLALTGLEAEDEGDYYVVVSNLAGTATSDTAALTLGTPPVVTPPVVTQVSRSTEGFSMTLTAKAVVVGEEPATYEWSQASAVAVSDNVTLTATVTGVEPITYQWHFEDSVIEGATGNPLRLAKVQLAASGDYHVVISNRLGTDTSETISLLVEPPPAVTELAGLVKVSEGDSVELSVTAVGGGSLSYQWSRADEAIEVATGSTLDLGAVDGSVADDYKVEVSNAGELVGLAVITVTTADPVIIVTQPQGGSVDLGDAFTMEVVATGTEPVTYEWYFGGEPVEGGTGSTLALTGLEVEDAGDYHVVVSNAAGEATSETASLTVELPPTITGLTESAGGGVDLTAKAVVGPELVTYEWSQNGTWAVGDPFGLTATVTGAKPISYEWYFDGQLIDGATYNPMVLVKLSVGDSGEYHVVVSNRLGTDTSETITLAVAATPTVTEVTGSIEVIEGENVELSVTAVGGGTLAYQWSWAGKVIEGADGSSYSLGSFESRAAGDYSLAVSEGGELVGSVVITVAMVEPVTIVTQPEGGSADLGGAFTFEVVAEGAEPISYEWYFAGAPVEGGTGSILQLTDLEAEDAGAYHVVVSNLVGSVTSDTATLTVELPPTITQLAQSVSGDRLDLAATAEVAGVEPLTYEWSQAGPLLAGGDIDLIATVTGAEPISYQWYFGDQLIDGVTGNTLRLAKAGVEASGDYHVVATNRLGTDTSETTTLAVKPSTTITELAGSISVYEGETIELSVTASGMTQLAYQWSLGETVIESATGPTLSLNSLDADAAGDYKLAISLDDRLVGEAVITISVPAVRIVTQPVGGSVDVGGSFTFEVVVVGTEPITYEWYHGGALIEEATGSTLPLTNLTGEDAGGYHVVVSNEGLPWGGEETSATATLVVLIPLAITHLTESKLDGEGNWQWALVGGTIDLVVTAEGTPPLSYQWTKDGEAITGATGPAMTLANLEPADAGDYTVKVSNAAEQLESETITVVVVTPTTAQPAKIVLQPKDATATLGETAELSVYAEGSEPISYQWYHTGALVENGTGRILSIPDVQQAAAGEYHVVVSNDGYPWGAKETSDTATLTIESPPVITKLTESLTVTRGDTIELSVTATGDEPLSYQWSRGGAEIEGATSPTLVLADATQSDMGDYTVTVSNKAGEAVSDVVTVSMPEPVRIVTQPQDVFAVVGESATLTVVVEGSEPIEYFWMYDGKWVEGGTESTLRLANLQARDFGAYNVLVRNQVGIEISKTAMLTVMSPPEITELTKSLTLTVGESVELTVTADGDEPFVYEWSRDGEVIEGANASQLSLPDVASSDAGNYTVVVSNVAGQAESGVVVVTIVAPIRIVTQPEGATAILGDTVMLQVVVEGTEPITYFWYHDGELVEGGTESTLRLAKVQVADSGSYNVLVQNQGGTAISDLAELVVLSPPEITQLTESLTVIDGESVELQVTAVGSEPLAYQWSKDGEAIEGATTPALRLAKVAQSDAGDYTVSVSNAAGQAESDVVTVKVIEPVRIVTQPEGATAILGDTVMLQVVVEGTEPITYAWYHDGEMVEGGTESSLRLAKVQVADSGSYNVLVQNEGGTAVSEMAELIVLLPPEITQLTESLTLIEGESVELRVTATGSEPLTYQWSKDGEAIEGATAPTLPLAKVAQSDAGDYTVAVSNAAGQAESDVVTVKVIEPVRIVTQPEGATAILGDTVMLQVVVEGTEPITYAWYHDGELVEGGTESSLRLAKVQAADSGVYHLVASNSGGTAKSKLAELIVLLPPEITQLTESLSVIERDSVELSVTAAGSEPLAYQWSKDGRVLEGATAPTLRLIRVAPAAAGDYLVSVSNAAGQVESDAISVKVIEPVRIVAQPRGADATLGDTVTLTVMAEGTEPINYFWLHNGRLVEGGTHSTLTLTELEAEDSGEYIVIVNNIGGKATSETAFLSVELPEGAYFVEDFDGLTLGPWVSDVESIGDGTDWTATPPTDWVTEQGGDHVPAAAAEFDGWTFVDPVSWYKTAGPERDQFTKGSGVIAVADSAQSGGKTDAKFSATMATPAIDIAGAQVGSLVLTYDSSWREVQRKRVVAAFEEDFEGDDVGALVTISGTASQALEFVKTGGEWPWLKLNGILKVTEAVFSQSGGMLIDDFSDGATFNEFEISFRMFMGRGTSRPADGLSISIGNDLPTLANPAEEGVPGAAFRVCFDAWDSGGGEAPAIEIFNGKKSIAIQKFDGKSGASDSEKFVKDDGEFLMMWDNKEWADVNIRVADGKATVNFRGYDVIDNVPIDLAPIEAAQFLFAARTGGANQKHYIDDIKIRLFDSSSSRVTVAYDGGEPVTLLELTSRTPTAYDETVSLKLDNPEGAKTAVVVWDYQGYDNWWAVDNITVAADIEPEPTLAGLATDKGRYVIGEPVTVSFIGGPGNPRDWIGIYRPDMTPGEQGSLAWKYVSGSTIAGDGLSDGSVTFANHLPVGSYVARFFRNDGYSQLADAVAFTVGDPPGVATDRLHYAPGEAITVSFTNGPGKPSDWISLMPHGETSSLAWAYVGGTRTPGDGLANGKLTFAGGLPPGEYRVLFLAHDGYRQLAATTFTVAGPAVAPELGFVNNDDGTITLTFEGRLQTAPTINGPWQVMDASSPVTLPTDQQQQFTRSVR